MTDRVLAIDGGNSKTAVLLVDADGKVLAQVRPESLLDERDIQGRRTTLLTAIYHVVEHFSTHTGQIVLLAKMFAGEGAIRFYDDAKNAAPLFLGEGFRDID